MGDYYYEEDYLDDGGEENVYVDGGEGGDDGGDEGGARDDYGAFEEAGGAGGEDDMYYGDDYAPVFEAERNVFERVGFGRANEILGGLIIGGGGMGKKLADFEKRMERFSITPLERFRLFTFIQYKRFQEDLHLQENDLDRLIDMIDFIPDVQYKNAIAYVIAYATLKKGKIDKEKLEKVIEETKNVDEVTLPDVIRYGRLWESLVKAKK